MTVDQQEADREDQFISQPALWRVQPEFFRQTVEVVWIIPLLMVEVEVEDASPFCMGLALFLDWGRRILL